jgi:AraC-like DNA-binding protein
MHLFLPRADLRGIVECAISVERAAGSVTKFPAMPRAMLTISLGLEGVPAVSLHTMSTQAATFEHAAPLRAFGLVLLPETAARLLGMSTGAVVDIALPWAEIAGHLEAARLDDALRVADGDLARLQALQASLANVLAREGERLQRTRAEALQRLCLAVGRDGAQAANELGLGERQLERRCRSLLGLTPKQLQRITRLHAVLSYALRQQRVPNADLCMLAGYYDQSHLIRDARLLTGATPRELVNQSHVEGAWWPLGAQRMLARCSH